MPARDTWELRAPMPTERSGHGLVVYRNRLWAMGGEGGMHRRRRAAPGARLRPDGKLRPGQRHLAAPRADADAAPCGRRRRDRRLDLRRRRRRGARRRACSRRCTRRSRWRPDSPRRSGRRQPPTVAARPASASSASSACHRVGLVQRLVVADAQHARKAHRDAALVPRAAVDALEAELEHQASA